MSFSFKPNQPTPAQTPSTATTTVAAPTSAPIKIGGMPLADREGPHKISLIKLVLILIFGTLVVATALLFAYERYLLSGIESKKQKLEEDDKKLGNLNLKEMRDLSNRMRVVKQVLAEHASVNTAFLLLEESIEHPITYTRFSLTKGAKAAYDLQLSAVAPSYKAVAQQLDTLKSETYKKEFIPSVTYDGLALDPTGKVNFNIKMPILIQGKLPEAVLARTPSAEPEDVSVSTSTATTTP